MDVIIVDMDGTLVDVSSVRHYVTGDGRNFDKFHRASLFCPPRDFVLDAVRRRGADGVVIVTARDARYERVTRDWLAKYDVGYSALYMRGWGDGRPDHEVKADILADIRRDGYRPVAAIDDRRDIAEVWARAGVPCFLVATDDAPA